MLKKIIGLSCFLLASSTYAAANNFACPSPSEIHSTDFTAPSIWTAPPMPHTAKGTVGLGLGGKVVKEFLGSEAARIGNKDGWVCVYRSEGGLSANEYELRIRKEAESLSYLRKFVKRIDAEFEKAEPYLAKYSKTEPLGFIGYQQKEEK